MHDLLAWALDSSSFSVSAHVVVDSLADWESSRLELERVLAERFGIKHATLQPETERAMDSACADVSCGPVYWRAGAGSR